MKIDLQTAPTRQGTTYPPPFDGPCRNRMRWRLGDAARLTQFGVNLLRLPPGAWSSQRHWHSAEDEFIYVLEGRVVLVTDRGEEMLSAGDCAGFPAGEADGHHLVNPGPAETVLLEIGSRARGRDSVSYPDIDLALPPGSANYVHKDGRPYK